MTEERKELNIHNLTEDARGMADLAMKFAKAAELFASHMERYSKGRMNQQQLMFTSVIDRAEPQEQKPEPPSLPEVNENGEIPCMYCRQEGKEDTWRHTLGRHLRLEHGKYHQNYMDDFGLSTSSPSYKAKRRKGK